MRVELRIVIAVRIVLERSNQQISRVFANDFPINLYARRSRSLLQPSDSGLCRALMRLDDPLVAADRAASVTDFGAENVRS